VKWGQSWIQKLLPQSHWSFCRIRFP
jgi:hypothetical protein